MSIWGTARPLFAKFEVGQNWGDLLAKFEVGQGSQNLFATAIIKSLDISELFAKLEVVHSEELPGKVIIRQTDTREIFGESVIRQSDLIELQAQVNITHWVVLYCKFEVGQDSVNLPGKIVVRGSSFAEAYAHVEIQDIAELYAHAIIRNISSAELLVKFEVGQGSADLSCSFEVGQGSTELFGKGSIRQLSSVEILCKLSIPVSRDLFAKFRLRQENLDLLGKLIVTRRGDVQDLPATFEVGQNSEGLWGSMIIRHPVQLNLYGALIVRHAGAPVELYGHAIIRHPASAEAYAHLVAKNIGSAELLCNFTTQATAVLYAKLVVGPGKWSDAYAVCNDPSRWINVVMGLGEGFITMPWVEADTVVKVCGNSSARLTSNRAPGSYKEIRFGWNGVCLGTPFRLGYDGILRSRVDFRREVPEQAFNELGARFYVVMASVLDFDNWIDLGLPGAWWADGYGVFGQTNPQSDHLEVVVVNNLPTKDNMNGIWHYIGTIKKYLGGTITFDLLFQDVYYESPIAVGAEPVVGFAEHRYAAIDYGGVKIGYDSREDKWNLVTSTGVGETITDISVHADFTQRHVYQIIWETPNQYPMTGRVRFYIDGNLKETITTNVPDFLCSFALGCQVGWIGPNLRSGMRLYAFSDA